MRCRFFLAYKSSHCWTVSLARNYSLIQPRREEDHLKRSPAVWNVNPMLYLISQGYGGRLILCDTPKARAPSDIINAAKSEGIRFSHISCCKPNQAPSSGCDEHFLHPNQSSARALNPWVKKGKGADIVDCPARVARKRQHLRFQRRFPSVHASSS